MSQNTCHELLLWPLQNKFTQEIFDSNNPVDYKINYHERKKIVQLGSFKKLNFIRGSRYRTVFGYSFCNHFIYCIVKVYRYFSFIRLVPQMDNFNVQKSVKKKKLTTWCHDICGHWWIYNINTCNAKRIR